MKITLWPKTNLGKWAAAFSVVFILFLWLKLQFRLPVISFAIMGLGLLGFVFAAVAITRKRERSILVFLSFLLGLVILIWVIAEIVYPH